jgi:hypothetical protein
VLLAVYTGALTVEKKSRPGEWSAKDSGAFRGPCQNLERHYRIGGRGYPVVCLRDFRASAGYQPTAPLSMRGKLGRFCVFTHSTRPFCK